MTRIYLGAAAIIVAHALMPAAFAQQAGDVVVSYLVGATGNQTLLTPGNSISFPDTNVGSTSSATLILTNRGSRPVTLNNSIMEATDQEATEFRVTGLPLLPAQIRENSELRLTLTFVPQQRVHSVGTLRLEFSGFVKLAPLEGTGSAPMLVYEWTAKGATHQIEPNGTVRLGETPVNNPIDVRFRITNQGNTEARIANITISGAGYLLLELPPLPVIVSPGSILDFALKFTPGEAGGFGGRLRLDAIIFDITATGVGSKFGFQATTEIGVLPLSPNTALTLPSIGVGSESVAVFQVENVGNAPGAISGVAVFGGHFTAEDLPPFPVRLLPGESMSFRVVFAPQSPGLQTANVEIDSHRFAIRGTGNAPPPVPATMFSFTADPTAPLQQPAVSLTLDSAYSYPLKGRLTLTFASESFGDDQTVQFATGGRVVDFSIPAGSTEAVFGETTKSIQFQTGTVSGNLVLAATYQVASVNVTPANSPSRSFAIPAAEPNLRSVRLGSRSATGFELIVSGYSTPRSVTDLSFTFQAAPGAQLATTALTANVESAFSAWYQNASSKTYGSQFTASIQITGTSDISGIESVSVTASNHRGTSAPISVSLR